ncbi:MULTISPECIES: GntR family transcriptional regulator [unclassified Caballeronia]|uniref:GntR family transcriptional regulator n=1 Tax=unclassified Caballeronia TaxID=2646786 RepID=UPI00285D9131|nr:MULTISPECIES: GntR family transcriptional regulator [unclassified Caballeronia]MDR5762854.1 GntR family transcriptional regulator [Caballeronia sp. LZ035]MDR5839130.1 GntR family transcriptional regulator [Caballeronia sp. LZ034LL]
MKVFDRASLSEQVELALKEEIIGGRVRPGQRINIGDFQTAWKVSSTPFRDALRSLEIQGFVTVEARKGVYVAPLDQQTVNEIFDLRIALECMAVERATLAVPPEEAERVRAAYLNAAEALQQGDPEPIAQADRQVHELAHVYCGNVRLQKALSSHMELIRWAQRAIVDKLTGAYEIALPEHIAIIEAVCLRDAQGAAKAMRAHLENSRDRLSANIDLADLDSEN